MSYLICTKIGQVKYKVMDKIEYITLNATSVGWITHSMHDMHELATVIMIISIIFMNAAKGWSFLKKKNDKD